MVSQVSRRAFAVAAMGSWLGVALVRQAAQAQALQGSVGRSVRPWLARMEAICAEVTQGTLKPLEWQREIESSLARVDRADLLRAINFDVLARNTRQPAEHEGLSRITFDEDPELKRPLHFSAYLFALRQGVSVVPHGHHNMVTMHMMLSGAARARHFDRVADEAKHLVIRPAGDHVIQPGDVTSISDDSHNIHWFHGLTQPVFMFNIGVYRVDPLRPSGDRDYVDPDRGERMAGGLLRAERLNRLEAYARYGKGRTA